MRYASAGFPAATVSDARRSPTRQTNVILDEAAWRALPQDVAAKPSPTRATVTRWRAVEQRSQEFSAETANDRHVVKIVLRTMNIRLALAGRTVHDGLATPGMFHVTEPGLRVRCLFRGPYDVLHLHVPNALIAECALDLPPQSVVLGANANPSRDPMLERLACALLGADQLGGSFGQLYADCIGIAIVTRLASARQAAVGERPKVSELARWRLKRAIDHVEARLAEPISLADMASAAGLTRMHFAAQFKAATGLRPHEYLLRRRIERAQDMLGRTGMSLVDVALSVGFQTQSHFTAVFKRFVGQPPHAWRRSYGDDRCQRACGAR